MKKILIFANDAVGLYNLRKEIISGLISEGHEVYVSLGKDAKVEKLEALGCHFIETNVDRRGLNVIKDTKLFFTYIRLIKKIKPDLIMTYAIKPNIYAGLAARLMKKKYIINITGIGTAFQKDNLLKKLVVRLYRMSTKKAVIFFQNEENMNIFSTNKIIGKKAILVPGSGVNLADFHYTSIQDEPVTKFLFIGRVMKEKGIDEYLEAARLMKKAALAVECHVLGDTEEDWYKETLSTYSKNGTIHYHGYTEDVQKFILEATCVVLPSYHEGMSNALLESAAVGRPLIASDISGCKEIIVDCVTGYLVEPKNVEDLVQKMTQFANLSFANKQQMGVAARAKIEKDFDRNIIVEEYIKCIAQMLSE